MIEDVSEAWVTGHLALALLAVDPAGLGGLHVRSRAGPVRDTFLRDMPGCLGDTRRIAPGLSDAALFGGIDLAGTLARGALVTSAGVIDTPGPLVLAMAERCPAELAARLGQTLDAGRGHALILLDEGSEPDERAPETLCERVAFSVSLDGLRAGDLGALATGAAEIAAAQRRLDGIETGKDALAALVIAAARFGITSLRAPLFALRAARAHAALMARNRVEADDLRIAAQLVYAHRAVQIPDDAETEEPPPPPDAPNDGAQSDSEDPLADLPADILVAAVKALLPPEILAALAQPGSGTGARGSGGAGRKRRGNRRGRPLPARRGKPDGTRRIDVITTLRAAAPWQTIRRKAQPDAAGILIRPGDIHIRQFQDHSDRLIVFAVDASGSAAMARLAEAKGAVELLLAEAYSRRDHVALIAFRGDGAQEVLPPTRSLVQAKRHLAGLPGGGGTPLAAGLKAAAELARRASGHGLSPSVALMTDGRANVPLPGRAGRAAAREDAETVARMIRAMNLPVAVIDTGNRPSRDLAQLAGTMAARYVPLPRADARGLSTAVTNALGS